MTLHHLSVTHPAAAGTSADTPGPAGAVDPASVDLASLSFARVMVQATSPKIHPAAPGSSPEFSQTATITTKDQAGEEPASASGNTAAPAATISPTVGGTPSELGETVLIAGFAPPPTQPGPTSAAPSTSAPDASVPLSGQDLKPGLSDDRPQPAPAGGHRDVMSPLSKRSGGMSGETPALTVPTGRPVVPEPPLMANSDQGSRQAHPLPQTLGVQSSSEAVPGRTLMTEAHPMALGTRPTAWPTSGVTTSGADTSPSAVPAAEGLSTPVSSSRETTRPAPEPGAQNSAGAGKDVLPRVPEPGVQNPTGAGRDVLPRVPDPGAPSSQAGTTNHPGPRQPVPIDGEPSAGAKPGGSAATDSSVTIRVPAVLPGSRPAEAAAEAMVLNEAAAARPRVEPGTASARISVGMKSSVSQEQTAARTVQKLPVTVPIEPLSSADRSVAYGTSGLTRPNMDRDRIAPLEFQTWEGMQRSLSVEPLRVDKGQGLLDDRVAASETLAARLERAITREVVSVRQLNADSMTVVLRLDPRSEIILNLRQHNGQMEASARCEPASFQMLNRDWAGLQESLAQMNVRLLPLERSPNPAPQTHSTADNPGGSGDSNHMADRSPRQHDLPKRGTEHQSGDDLGNERKPSVPARPQTGRTGGNPSAGWESWA